MTDESKRTFAAMQAICDGRDPRPEFGDDFGGVLVTLEGVVAGVLLAAFNGDARKAAAMLNEGLIEGVERRLALAEGRS